MFHIVPYCSILFQIVPYCSILFHGQSRKMMKDDERWWKNLDSSWADRVSFYQVMSLPWMWVLNLVRHFHQWSTQTAVALTFSKVVSPRVTKIAATSVCLWTLAKVSAFTTPRFDLVHLKFTLFIGTSFPCGQAFGAFSCRPLHHPGSAKSERKPRCNASGPICPILVLSKIVECQCKPLQANMFRLKRPVKFHPAGAFVVLGKTTLLTRRRFGDP